MLTFIYSNIIVNQKDGTLLRDPPAVSHDPDYENGDVAWEIIGENMYQTTLTFSVGSFINTNDGADDSIIFNKSYECF